MAITIEANYSKKLGLPEYSSHQYSVTVRTEVTDLSQIELESARLYSLLQTAVDHEIQNSGWLPGDNPSPRNAQHARLGVTVASGEPAEPRWNCSDRQRDLILKIVGEHNLDRTEVDNLARSRCGAGVRELNKLQASAVIDELLELYGKAGRGAGKHHSFRRAGSGTGRGSR